MRQRVLLMVVGFPAMLEAELEIGEQSRLIAFDGEHIMRLMLDEVVGELALGQQGIGGEGFPGQLEGLDERDDRADLVGLFGSVVAG